MEGRTLLEVATLIAVVRLEHNAYGMTIREEIESFRGEPVALASVYAALQRLTHDGWLTVARSHPLAIQGGRTKRLYTLTALGPRELLHERRQWNFLWSCLPRRFQ
jgi:DNA-binding PadR family transcriptional regulator